MRSVLPFAFVLLACGAKPVDLSGQWPVLKADDYDEVTERWTRSGKLRGDTDENLSVQLEVAATFHSPEWRAAYVALLARGQKLPTAKREALVAEHRKLSEEFYEVALLVSTYHPRENELQKGDRSIWRVALVDAAGNEVEATEVVSDRRPPAVIKKLYPQFGDFAEAYVARFPRASATIYGTDGFAVKVGSVRGGVELIWKAK